MKRFVTVVLGLVLTASLVLGTTQKVDEFAAQNSIPLQVEQRVLSSDGMQLRLQVNDPEWLTVGEPGAEAEVVSYSLAGATTDIGMPVVPVTGRMFRIPPQSGVVVEVVDAEYQVYSDVDYATYLGQGLDEIFATTDNPVDEWYPGELAKVGEPAVFHDFRVGNLVTYPVQVNTARREVRVYTNIEVEIRFEGTDNRNTISHWPTKISEAFLPAYRLLLDWDDDELDEYTLYRGHVQVVMQDDPVLWEALEEWIEWKRQRGWVLDFLTDSDVNWSAASIRNELINRFEASDPKFDYVVIIGDDTGSFPTPPGASGYGAGDQPYSELVGDDNLADVGVGRISVTSVQDIAKYNSKVFNYERDPYMADTTWYNRGMLNRSDNHPGISKIVMLRYVRHAMLALGYAQVDTSYNIGNNIAIQRINAGVSFYGARGYYNSGITCAQINSLDNDYMTPVVVDVTCGTGDWSGGTGINECYMRAGTVAVPTGGVCGMSMATTSTEPNYNNCVSSGACWAMMQLGMPALGDMIYMGKVNGWANYHGHDDSGINSFLQWFNLMGDPTIWTWVDVPRILTVDVVEELELGENSITVEVVDNNGPVADALVTFYKYSEGEEIQVTKLTDANGHVTLEAMVRAPGEATVTVVKRHYKPEQIDVDVQDPASRVGWIDISYVDNGTGGTSGDGDGVPDAGETVGLQMELKNYGTSAVSNIEVSAEEDEEWITSISGSVTLATLAADAQAQANGLILVEIDPEAQQDWILHLNLTAETSAGDFDDACEIDVQAPAYGFVELDIDGTFNPGDIRNADITVRNIGGNTAAASTALLYSNDPYVRVSQAEDDLNAMAVNQMATGSFTLDAHEGAMPGYVGWIHMVVTTNDGNVDTVGIPVEVGTRESTDPNGPDNYGYFAFDNTDTGYEEFMPTYNWVEINPDADEDYTGHSLNLSDPDENDDDGCTIDLPFDVQYYGQAFDEISITTNGYAAFGRNADVTLSRNWTIPSPLGPNNMLAVYWDELRTANTTDILYYYDEPNGRFIIEWYDMKHANPTYSCTFELIIYSQDERPTWTGDNDILFQYNHVQHSTNGDGYPMFDVPFWTTGIENATQSDGILISYWNQYTAGSATIEDGRAILFTTNIPLIVGHIQGNITATGSGDPIVGAWIGTENGLFEAFTDAEGHYFLENVMIGPVSFNVESDCYNSLFNQVLTVTENETLSVDFELNHPEFEVLPLTISDSLEGTQTRTHSMWVYNPGNGVMNWEAHYDFEPDEPTAGKPGSGAGIERTIGDELDEPWDTVYDFDLTDDDMHHRGVEFDGKHFWVSGSNNYDVSGPNKMYMYSRTGELIKVCDQPVPAENRSSQGFYGLEWDGDYMYGADGSTMYQMTFNDQDSTWETVSTFEIPTNPARYIAKDPETGIFFVGDYGTEIRVVHPDSATILREFGQDFSPRGAAWFPEDADGYNLYFIAYVNGDDNGWIIKMHPESGDTMHVKPYENEGVIPCGACISYLWNPQIWMFASMMDGGDDDYLQLWEIEQFDAWITLNTTEGTIAPGDSQEVVVEMTAGNLPPEKYDIYIRYDHDACIAEDNFVHIVMTVPGTDIEDEQPGEAQPLEWAFEGAYPNPFNPSTTVAFALKNTADVRLSVFNLLGQEVVRLVDQPMQSGRHSVTFDGSRFASGIYFLHLNAGPLQETRKIVLMK